MKKYNFKEIEKKWQKFWEENKTFSVKEDQKKEKFYLLEMFPYPSGELHMGHMRNYAIGDTLARYLRMKGYNVLYPMGYDALGLPAENAAIKHKINPWEWTKKNIEKMMEQQKKMGLSYDWSRLVITALPEYYKWNQYFFLLLYKMGLVYRKKAPINFCPSCDTVLANEQVHSGKCWRCGTPVEIRELEQWFIKITAYAERLLKDLDELDGWPERVKIMQRNWIGRSEGAKVRFPLIGMDEEIEIFTTRPDTLWGVTFLLLSPFHPLIEKIANRVKNKEKIFEFVNKCKVKEKLVRDFADKEKEGEFLEIYALNPLTGEKVPVFVANFVLMEYGTGAIMSVPAHDQRDFEFAKKYNLPIKVVIKPYNEDLNPSTMECAYEGDGIMINSNEFTGKDAKEARKILPQYLKEKGIGEKAVEYRLRDWLISRQRYWGTPIPIVYCKNCGVVPVKEEELPVLLPSDVEFTGRGNPLKTSESFLKTKCPKCSGPAIRETDTMDTFFDSSWYFLRYLDNKNDKEPFSREKADYWMPVDQYIGGIEHATMHLIYSRFFYKVLSDAGFVKGKEPFKNLLCQGMVTKDGFKMSKSKGNVVSVDFMTEKYGSDTARVFILFASPPEKDLLWSEEGVEGSFRFLKRIWNLINEDLETKPDENVKNEIDYFLNLTIKKVTEDIENFQFNTAIAAIMEFLNKLEKFRFYLEKEYLKEVYKKIVLLLYPFAPHITSELWEILGNKNYIWENKFPEYSDEVLKRRNIIIVVQINGKVRDKIEIAPSEEEEEIKRKVYESEKVKKFLEGKKIVKEFYVKNKIYSIVVR